MILFALSGLTFTEFTCRVNAVALPLKPLDMSSTSVFWPGKGSDPMYAL